jgi:hypothetical protein
MRARQWPDLNGPPAKICSRSFIKKLLLKKNRRGNIVMSPTEGPWRHQPAKNIVALICQNNIKTERGGWAVTSPTEGGSGGDPPRHSHVPLAPPKARAKPFSLNTKDVLQDIFSLWRDLFILHHNPRAVVRNTHIIWDTPITSTSIQYINIKMN